MSRLFLIIKYADKSIDNTLEPMHLRHYLRLERSFVRCKDTRVLTLFAYKAF